MPSPALPGESTPVWAAPGGARDPGAGFVGLDPTASLVEDVIVVGRGYGFSPTTLYLDTSVIGGYFDPEFENATLPLIDRIRNGDAILLTSQILLDELKPAPDRVQAMLNSIPKKYTRHWHTSALAKRLARTYLEERILGPSSKSDALHVACATMARADALLSWNLKHMVHPEKIRRFREVNRYFGQGYFEIVRPDEVFFVN